MTPSQSTPTHRPAGRPASRLAVPVTTLALVAAAAGTPVMAAPPAAAVGAAAGAAPAVAAGPAALVPARSLGQRTLRYGHRGRDVRQLQRLLAVKRTGTFDKRTRRAVKRVERAARLKPNGVVSRKTLRAIKKSAKARTRAAQQRRASRSARTPAASKSYARSYIRAKYGWGAAQMSCLTALWTRESGWRYQAANGRYRGIPQTSAAVWGAQGYSTAQYLRSPQVQVKVGTRYIRGRYGTPCRAWSFWQARHWY